MVKLRQKIQTAVTIDPGLTSIYIFRFSSVKEYYFNNINKQLIARFVCNKDSNIMKIDDNCRIVIYKNSHGSKQTLADCIL
jgi:hypothetical protein